MWKVQARDSARVRSRGMEILPISLAEVKMQEGVAAPLYTNIFIWAFFDAFMILGLEKSKDAASDRGCGSNSVIRGTLQTLLPERDSSQSTPFS